MNSAADSPIKPPTFGQVFSCRFSVFPNGWKSGWLGAYGTLVKAEYPLAKSALKKERSIQVTSDVSESDGGMLFRRVES